MDEDANDAEAQALELLRKPKEKHGQRNQSPWKSTLC
ncbi:MAG: hypothetical protein ACI9KE_003764 [Polyangiales bacterium]|jgi:hypothetical protein